MVGESWLHEDDRPVRPAPLWMRMANRVLSKIVSALPDPFPDTVCQLCGVSLVWTDDHELITGGRWVHAVSPIDRHTPRADFTRKRV